MYCKAPYVLEFNSKAPCVPERCSKRRLTFWDAVQKRNAVLKLKLNIPEVIQIQQNGDWAQPHVQRCVT